MLGFSGARRAFIGCRSQRFHFTRDFSQDDLLFVVIFSGLVVVRTLFQRLEWAALGRRALLPTAGDIFGSWLNLENDLFFVACIAFKQAKFSKCFPENKALSDYYRPLSNFGGQDIFRIVPWHHLSPFLKISWLQPVETFWNHHLISWNILKYFKTPWLQAAEAWQGLYWKTEGGRGQLPAIGAVRCHRIKNLGMLYHKQTHTDNHISWQTDA